MRYVTLIATNHKDNREIIFDMVTSIKVIITKSGYFLYRVNVCTKDGVIYIHNISSYEWDEIKILHH